MRRLISKITGNGYEQVEQAGNTALLDDMLCSRRAPASVTDREFFAGRPKLDEQFKDDFQLKTMVGNARANGYNPSPNDVYLSQLARFPGDPQAFVSSCGGRNQIRRTLEGRGWGGEGIVNVRGIEDIGPPPAPVPLAKEIVDGCVTEMLRENPDLQSKPVSELREMAVDQHGSSD